MLNNLCSQMCLIRNVSVRIDNILKKDQHYLLILLLKQTKLFSPIKMVLSSTYHSYLNRQTKYHFLITSVPIYQAILVQEPDFLQVLKILDK